MNKYLSIFILMLPLLSFANSKALICTSFEDIDGWKAVETHGKVRFTAYVDSSTDLSKAEINGAFASDRAEVLSADKDYRPRSERYKNYNRFRTMEDAWCWFDPLMPKNLGEMDSGAKFVGYIQMICEEGRNQQSIAMSCFLK